MAEAKLFNSTNLVAIGSHSGKSFTNVVKRNGVNVYFMEYTIDTTLDTGTPTYTHQIAVGNLGYFVGYGDGSVTPIGGGDWTNTHTYSSGGTYNVRITGQVGPRVNITTDGSKKITSASRWDSWYLKNGLIGWFGNCLATSLTGIRGMQKYQVASMRLVFGGCTNLTTIGDVFDFDPTTPITLWQCFNGATSFNDASVEGWTVKASSLQDTFNSASSFNRDISGWDVSACTTFEGAFQLASSFNQSLGAWDTSSLADTTAMFRQSGFNDGNTPGAAGGGPGIGIDTWDMRNVTNMREMFRDCDTFNSYIGSWQLHKVTDLGIWAFSSANFNPDLSNWDFNRTKSVGANTSVVTNKLVDSGANFVSDGVEIGFLVRNLSDKTLAKATVTAVSATELTLSADIFTSSSDRYIVWSYNWAIFYGFNSSPFNSGLAGGVSGTRMSAWDTQGLTSLSQCFTNTGFNQDVSTWKVNELTDSTYAFKTNSFNQDLSGWERSTVGDESSTCRITTMNNCFAGTSFNAGLSAGTGGTRMGNWDTSGCTDFGAAFAQSAFNQDIGTWSLQGSLSSMFSLATNFNCGAASGVSNNNFRSCDVSGVTSFASMFSQASAVNQEIGAPVAPDTSPSWDVSGANSLSNMLFFATSWNQDLSPWIFQTGANASNLCFQSGISDANIAASLVGWDNPSQGLNVNATGWCARQPGITPRTLAIATYPAAKTAYDNLIAPTGSGGKGWDMTGAITWV
jgi:hypothetical protein